MSDDTVWVSIRCPHCGRWLGALDGQWPYMRRIRLKCSLCKKEWVFPFDPSPKKEAETEKVGQ